MFKIAAFAIVLLASRSGQAVVDDPASKPASTASLQARSAAPRDNSPSPATQSPTAGIPPLPEPPAPDSVSPETTAVGLHQETLGWIRETRYIRRRGGEWTLSSDSLQARPSQQ